MKAPKSDTSARWRLESIEIENFRGVNGKRNFEFRGMPSLVFGDNGVGKSTIALALEWSLFGEFPSHVFGAPKAAFMLPVGTTQKGCRGEVVFVRGTERLVVRRDQDEDTFVITRGRAKYEDDEAEAELERALGLDADTFVRAVLLQQSRIRGVLLDEPKERNKALDRLLGMETAEVLLEIVKPRPFNDAADAWRQEVEAAEERYENQQELLKRQLDKATKAARDQKFLNKDLSAAGLKARYAELSKDLVRTGKKHGVEIASLDEVRGAKAAKKASIAVEKELKRIRVGGESNKQLADINARMAKRHGVRTRYASAVSARGEAQKTLDLLVQKHGDPTTRATRCEELVSAVAELEKELRAAGELRSLLSQAKAMFAAKAQSNCPVCEQPISDNERVLRSIGERMEALTTKGVRDIEKRLAVARTTLAGHDQVTQSISDAGVRLAATNKDLEAERKNVMKQLNVESLLEKHVLQELDKAHQRDDAEQKRLTRGAQELENELGVITDRDRALRDGLVPLLEAREELARLEEQWEKTKAGFGKADAQAQRLEATATDIETIRKALLSAKNEIVSVTLDRARPRAQELYAALVQHRLFDQLQVKTAQRAHKVDYAFEVSSSDLPKSGREARLVLSDGQMTASALALFFALAESGQHELDLLYVDDPTQNLDHPRKEAMARVVTDIAKRRQVVVSTQDEDFVALLQDLGFQGRAVVHNIVGWDGSPKVKTAMAASG